MVEEAETLVYKLGGAYTLWNWMNNWTSTSFFHRGVAAKSCKIFVQSH